MKDAQNLKNSYFLKEKVGKDLLILAPFCIGAKRIKYARLNIPCVKLRHKGLFYTKKAQPIGCAFNIAIC